MPNPLNAPYTGGLSPGAPLFAVDGDFTQLDPSGAPEISYFLKGDSVFSEIDTVTLDMTQNPPEYKTVPLGTYPNIQPFSFNQRSFMIKQEFMVAQAAWTPPPLNTPYDNSWSLGWTGILTNGQPTGDLSTAVLVQIGELLDAGGGISKVVLYFASVPPTRNEFEQFTYNYPGFGPDQNSGIVGRTAFLKTVYSRIQYDFFIVDDFGILSTDLWPVGNRLDSTIPINQPNLILDALTVFSNNAGAVAAHSVLSGDSFNLADPDSMGNPGTTPRLLDWDNWLEGISTSNGFPPEIIAESSTWTRLMGNIFERRTRFVPVF